MPTTKARETALDTGTMLVYRPGDKVTQSDLVDLGPPSGLGGTVLEGDPRISARIDYSRGGLTAGVFQATRGRVRIEFPFTEHATILDGEVELTDDWGNHARLGPGDSYLVTQGSVILWEVRGEAVQKTFLNRRAAGSPAPMVVYPHRRVVPTTELIDLGPPESLGGAILAGEPKLSGRPDFRDEHATAGVFQATPGDAQIRFPFTEHSTIRGGAVTLRDQTGRTHRFEPGDTYLIRQNSSIFWHVAERPVQKSFLNVVEP